MTVGEVSLNLTNGTLRSLGSCVGPTGSSVQAVAMIAAAIMITLVSILTGRYYFLGIFIFIPGLIFELLNPLKFMMSCALIPE